MNPKVISIVLTWNSAEFISETLDSLVSSQYPTEVLIVDNNSSDMTRQLVAERYPSIRLINSGDNLGYAGGNNFGMKLASEYNSDYIFILNPDAAVGTDCIGTLVERMERSPKLAGVSPLIYFHGSKDKLWFAGSTMKWRTGERIQLPTKDDGKQPADGITEFLSGCAMLIRTDAAEKTGLMDERYFLYCEETDWSIRFKKQGYDIGLQGNAKAWHRASSSTGGFYSPLYQYYINRNRLLLIRKHRPLLLPVVAFSSVYMNTFRLITISRTKGSSIGIRCAKSVCKAYFDFILNRFGRRSIPN